MKKRPDEQGVQTFDQQCKSVYNIRILLSVLYYCIPLTIDWNIVSSVAASEASF